jgi:hypothetical protein
MNSGKIHQIFSKFLLIMCFLLKLYLVRVAEYLLPMSEIEVVKFDKQCFWIHNISVLLNLFLDIT